VELETINKLYLELSQIATATTGKELKLINERDRLLVLATKHCPHNHQDWKEVLYLSKFCN
jgi:hypothetical protein